MEQVRLEQTILKNLVQSESFTRKVIPFLKEEYFSESDEKTVFNEVVSYFDKYTKPPTVEALLINLDNNTSLNDGQLSNAKTIVDSISKDSEETPTEWLVEETEKWCQDRAIYIAVMDSIEVIDKKSQRSTGEIPDLLKEALYLYRLTLTLVTISLKTQMIDLNSTTLKKKNFHLTWNTSTRLPKVVFQTKL